ncbi:MAG: YihY/virulence factor BrkB family protein [Bauldia sp.]
MMRGARIVITDAFGHFNSDDGWAMASHVALSTLMAVFPFLIFVAALAGFVGHEALAERVAEILFQAWPSDIAGPIAAEVKRVVGQAHVRLLTIAAVVAVYLASNGVEATRTALNRAYRVVDRRSFLFRWAQSVVFVIAGAAASLMLAFVVVLGPAMAERIAAVVPVLAPLEAGSYVGRLAVTALVVVVVLVASHLWLPAGRPHWPRLWPGIALTLVLWVAEAAILAIYIGRFANLAATYAGLAGVVAAIFFLYLVAVSLIFGAEFNAALGRLRSGRTG